MILEKKPRNNLQNSKLQYPQGLKSDLSKKEDRNKKTIMVEIKEQPVSEEGLHGWFLVTQSCKSLL